MRKNKVIDLIRSHHFFPLVLLLIVLITYGLLTPWLGFQGDDWHLLWLHYRIGNLNPFFNLTRFSTEWPFQLIMPWMAPVAWQWFLLSILLRWLSGISLYLLLERLFPGQKEVAGLFTLLYCLYPGFLVSYLPITFLAPFIQPICLFLSFYWMILWLENQSPRRNLFLALALFASAANLLLSEYFFFLELLRVVILWRVMQNTEEDILSFSKLINKLKLFLIIFLLIFGIRVATQIQSAGRAITTYGKFISQSTAFIIQWLQQILRDFYTIILQPFFASLIPRIDLHPAQGLIAFSGAALVALVTLIYFFKRCNLKVNQRNNLPGLVALGLVTFFLAGLPFWLGGLQPVFGFDIKNRVAMPQGLCFAILLFALLSRFPARWKFIQAVFSACLMGSFALLQLQSAALFRAEWDQHRRLMWQLAWRIPQLERGSVLLMNDPGFQLSGENSVSAELNWNFAGDPHPSHADYFVYFDEHRFLGDFADIHSDQTLRMMHMLGPVAVNPSQLLVVHFDSSGCLRLLDPQIDELDGTITDFTHKYIRYSNLAVIQVANPLESGKLDPAIFWDEPEHGWCYFFQKADLARQLGDWQTVVMFANLAMTQRPASYDPAEILPYIEGFAHSGDWQKAMQLSESILKGSASTNRWMCALWQRIARTTPASPQKKDSLDWMTSMTGCNF